MGKNILADKSFAFAVRTVRLCRFLRESNREYVLSKQLLRSGTSIGALIRESMHAESKRDFIHKLSIALKEAEETIYWTELLQFGEEVNGDLVFNFKTDCRELIRLLISSIKTAKLSLN